MPARRQFLKSSAYTLGFLGLSRLTHAAPADRTVAPYGPLVPDPEGLLDLPEGFRYRVFSRTGDLMGDGLRVPGKHDGMAAFPGPGGTVVLVRNHELGTGAARLGPFAGGTGIPDGFDDSRPYDAGDPGKPLYAGGTTTVVYDPDRGEVVREFLSLYGTDRNCAGGAMPWGSWITCEEPENLTSPEGKRHGWCFEVRATADGGLQKAVPLRGLGRFRHEAVALDPESGILYLTEDRNDGLLYRFLPKTPGRFADGGTLQALALRERGAADLRNYNPKAPQVAEGSPMPVEWIDLEDTAAPKDDLRLRGHRAGAARFARGEGIHHDNGAVFICCTDGGPTRRGQIYKLTPGDDSLELFLQPDASDLLTNGDNLTVAPSGDLIICEDLVVENGGQAPHVRGVTPDGHVYTLARNARNRSEFAGSTFSPDGRILFVNVQNPGYTFAITGPWRS